MSVRSVRSVRSDVADVADVAESIESWKSNFFFLRLMIPLTLHSPPHDPSHDSVGGSVTWRFLACRQCAQSGEGVRQRLRLR
jgi:hypothetical protein